MRDRAATNHNVTNKWSESLLLVTLIALLLVGSLGGWLLLLLLVLGLGARSLCQGLFKDLEDLLVGDLLVGLEGLKIWCLWCAELCETVLGDGCDRG